MADHDLLTAREVAARLRLGVSTIYDHPARPDAVLAGTTTDMRWNAEACVTCRKTPKDKVLGCVTYGFTRAYNSSSHSFGPPVVVGPGCLATPTAAFTTTVRSDPTTSSYQFDT